MKQQEQLTVISTGRGLGAKIHTQCQTCPAVKFCFGD